MFGLCAFDCSSDVGFATLLEKSMFLISQQYYLTSPDTAEERTQITERMLLGADRISAKDTNNKDILNGILRYCVKHIIIAL